MTVESGFQKAPSSGFKSWWQNLSTFCKFKIVVLSILIEIMLLSVIVIGILHFQTSEAGPLQDKVCNEPDCINAAAEILGSIDSNANPCENFYKFACGNYLKSEYNTRETKNAQQKIQESILTNVKTLLDNHYESDRGIPRFVQLAKNLYASCLDKHSIDKNIDEEIEKVLSNFDWYRNLKNNETVEDFNWVNVLEELKNVGLPSELFVTATSTSTDVSAEKNMRIFDLRASHSKNDHGGKYENGFKFEKKLRNLKNEIENEEKELFTITEIKKNFNNSLLGEYIEKRMDGDIENCKIRTSRNFLEQFDNIIQESTKTEQAACVVNKVLNYVKQFKNVPLEPRAQLCTQIVIEALPEATGSMYVKAFSSKQAKEEASKIASTIKDQLVNSIKNTGWMDTQSKNSAVKKVEDVTLQVAYPEEFLNDRIMSDLYRNVIDDGKNFMRTKLALNVLNSNMKIDNIWTEFANVLRTGSEYIPERNTIRIYAGILQEPLFTTSRPKYSNYGPIGWFIGQNLIQALDINNLSKKEQNYGSWTNEARKIYDDKINCIAKQYDGFTKELHKKVNDTKLPLGDFFAISEGLREAYLAYHQKYIKGATPEMSLPGLDYPPEQMFWISAASSKCVEYSEEDYENLLNGNDDCLPNEYKVNGAMRNSEQFSKDFKCELGSRMNPEEKCIVF